MGSACLDFRTLRGIDGFAFSRLAFSCFTFGRFTFCMLGFGCFTINMFAFSSFTLSVVKPLSAPEDSNYWWADSMVVVEAKK